MSSGLRSAKKHIPFLLLLLAGAVLLLTRLGDQYLWQDEAQTCLISQTVLEKGMPYGTDGINYFSQELGAEYGENHIWKWHTWLPFYLQAFFFWLFGTSNFISRLPFALCGIGTLVYLYLLLRKFVKEKPIAAIAVAVLITNTGFLLLSRQARLYSPSIMLTAASFYYFFGLVDRRKYNGLLFILSTTLLFHTHYFYYGSLMISLGIFVLWCWRSEWLRLLLPVIISGLISLPFMLWLRDIGYGDNYDFNFDSWFIYRFSRSYGYSIFKNMLGDWVFNVIAIVVLVLLMYRPMWLKRIWRHNTSLFLLMIIYSVISFILLVFFTPVENFRYLSTLYIPVSIALASALYLILRANKIVGFLLIALLAFAHHFHAYLYEITHDYNGPIEGICTYLNKHADDNDTVLITYGDLPVKWYTGLRTYGGLTGEDLAPAASAEWIIRRKHTASEKDEAVRAFIDKNVDLSHYERIEIPYPDYRFENREDPLIRVFYGHTEDHVVLYRKIK